MRAIYFMGRQTGRTLFILREVENMIEQDGIKRVYEEMKAFKESDEPVYPMGYPMGKEEVYEEIVVIEPKPRYKSKPKVRHFSNHCHFSKNAHDYLRFAQRRGRR